MLICWAIEGSWRQLKLFRLGDEDLLLSKLMRDDPQDRLDAMFIVGRREWGKSKLEAVFARARVPEIAEFEEQFRISTAKLIALVADEI